MTVSIRPSIEEDFGFFFINQLDEEANYMAAFTPKNPKDREAFMTKWKRLLKDDLVNMQSILVEGKVIGCVVKFVMEEDAEITYAIDKEFWSSGITSKAVNLFLTQEISRPMYGRVAFDNYGSQKVLEKAGFKRVGTNQFYANARGMEIEEIIYKLDA